MDTNVPLQFQTDPEDTTDIVIKITNSMSPANFVEHHTTSLCTWYLAFWDGNRRFVIKRQKFKRVVAYDAVMNHDSKMFFSKSKALEYEKSCKLTYKVH